MKPTQTEPMNVTFDMTQIGGQLGPVQFRLGSRTVEPFSTAPWCDQPGAEDLIPLLRELRGDFFCAPFGAGPAWQGEEHPPHGETANGTWQVESRDATKLVATLQTSVRPGRVTKIVEAAEGETNLYQTHLLEGFQGSMCLGHHAMLDFKRNGPGLISTSPIQLAQVLPVPFENPVDGGYCSLQPGAWFERLDHVPMANGEITDLSRFPAREGFEDLVMIRHMAADDFAWAAVVFPEQQFVWFSLKNPAHLASTVLWHSNGGRHYAPWNGRHRGVLGIEEVTAYFHLGLAASLADNPWKDQGVATSVDLGASACTRVPYIMGIAALSPGFDRVKTIERTATGIRLCAESGSTIDHVVNTQFLQ